MMHLNQPPHNYIYLLFVNKPIMCNRGNAFTPGSAVIGQHTKQMGMYRKDSLHLMKPSDGFPYPHGTQTSYKTLAYIEKI